MKHRNIPKDTRTLFFTTSPRSPHKMIPEVKLLINNFEGKAWNKDNQKSFMELLATQDFFEDAGPTKNLDLSARDRINRAPQLLGFVNLEDTIQKTATYEKLISGQNQNEIFLRQLLKFQLPSPLKPESSSGPSVFWVRPYLEILRLVFTLGYLSRDEMAIFGMQLTDWRNFDSIKEKIISLRKKKKNRKTANESYRDFLGKIQMQEALLLYNDVIQSGNFKKRESDGENGSKLVEYLEAKISNCYDYADACRRYLRFTGLIKVDVKSRSISIASNKIDEVDWILKNTERNPVHVNDLIKYQKYLFDSKEPLILQDDEVSLRKRLVSFGIEKETVDRLSVSELYECYEQEQQKCVEKVIETETNSLKSYEDYDDIMSVFDSLVDRNTPDKPLLLEWNVWRALAMIDHGLIEGNFVRDANGLPEETAGPGIPDIICRYNDFDLIVEVTMQSGRRQYNSEGEPVADHVGRHKIESGKPTYCIFIAPTINENVISYFYGIDQINMAAYGGKSKIVPLALDDFKTMLERANASEKPKDTDIKQLLDSFIDSIQESGNELLWYQTIKTLVANWMPA